jgi:hypothetical protein
MQEACAVLENKTEVKKRETFIPLELRPDLNVYVSPTVDNKEVNEKDTFDRCS